MRRYLCMLLLTAFVAVFPFARATAEPPDAHTSGTVSPTLGQQVVQAIRGYTAEHSDVYGGIVVDEDTKTITVSFTRDADQHLEAISPLVPSVWTLQTRLVANTLEHLDATHAAIDADHDALSIAGYAPTLVSTDEAENAVIVGLPRVSEGATGFFRTRYGESVNVVELQTSPLSNDVTDAPPVRGGQFITRPDSSCSGCYAACTTAFVGQQPQHIESATIYVMFALTAGHCGHANDVFSQNYRYKVGAVTRTGYASGSNYDGASIKLATQRDASNQVFIRVNSDGTHAYRAITSVQALGSDYVGEKECASGWKSGYRCGTITSLNATVSYPASAGFPATTLYHQRFASFASQGGDSGGSIFYNNQAAGITSGSVTFSNGTKNTIYTALGYAQSGLSVFTLTS